MLGGEFRTHGAIVEAEVRVNDAGESRSWRTSGSRFRMTDEWYRFRPAGPGRTVLLSFDRNPPDGVGTAGEAVDLPLAWQKTHGSGRVFYTALGHPPRSGTTRGSASTCAKPFGGRSGIRESEPPPPLALMSPRELRRGKPSPHLRSRRIPGELRRASRAPSPEPRAPSPEPMRSS